MKIPFWCNIQKPEHCWAIIDQKVDRLGDKVCRGCPYRAESGKLES